MARKKGRAEDAIMMTLHHFHPTKARLFLRAGMDERGFEYRFSLAETNLVPVLEVLTKVRESLEKGDLEAARAAINTEVEFGHDFGRDTP